jgi:hypothetical protein
MNLISSFGNSPYLENQYFYIPVLTTEEGAGEKQRSKINRSMESINPRQAISNIREFEFGEIFNTK